MNRTCRKCHEDLPLARFEEYKPGKRRWVCLTCRYSPYLKGEPPGTKPGRARNGEDIRAETAEGRTCLGTCGEWRAKGHFRVVDGKLWSYCTDCWNTHQKDRYRAEKDDPEQKHLRYLARQNTKNKLRREVIAGYGGKCACCGEDQPEFLTLDHVNNDGAKHRKDEKLSTGGQTWAYARKHNFPDIFQLLCWNCNCAKGMLGYCPHEFQ